MADTCASESSAEIRFNSQIELNFEAIKSLVDRSVLSYNGKQFRWANDFDSLTNFVQAIGINGKWSSPGGKSKKFVSSDLDLIVTWYYGKQGSLLFRGEHADIVKKFFINKLLPCISTTGDDVQSKCDCQCGVLAAELEGVKLELVILQKTVETKITSSQESHGDEVTQLRYNYANERERCERLEADISILVKGRDREISELNNIIVSLTNKVKSIEALNESLQKSTSAQSTQGIQNNPNKGNLCEDTDNYVNSFPLPLMHEHDKRKTIEDYTQKEIASVGKFNNNQLDKIWQECLPQNSSYDLKEKSSSVSAQFQKRQNDKVSLAQTEPSDEYILHDLNVCTNSFIPNTAVQHRNIIHPVNQNNDQRIPVRITQRGKSRPIRKKVYSGIKKFK